MLDKIAISSIYILLFYLQSKVVLQVVIPCTVPFTRTIGLYVSTVPFTRAIG